MSDNWLLYSWPVTNFFWYPRAKTAPRPWLQVRYDAWTGNRIPFVHSHTPVLPYSCFQNTFPSLLWFCGCSSRHPCNEFAMTARSHNTAQMLRRLHTKRSLTTWDTHDGRRAQDLVWGWHIDSFTQISQTWHHKIPFYHDQNTFTVSLITTKARRYSFINPRCSFQYVDRPNLPSLALPPSHRDGSGSPYTDHNITNSPTDTWAQLPPRYDRASPHDWRALWRAHLHHSARRPSRTWPSTRSMLSDRVSYLPLTARAVTPAKTFHTNWPRTFWTSTTQDFSKISTTGDNSPTMPQSQKDLDDLLQTYFNATEYRHLSIPSRTNFSKYLQSYPEHR